MVSPASRTERVSFGHSRMANVCDLPSAAECSAASRKVRILSAPFWHYLHFLVQPARIFAGRDTPYHSSYTCTPRAGPTSLTRGCRCSTPGQCLTLVVQISLLCSQSLDIGVRFLLNHRHAHGPCVHMLTVLHAVCSYTGCRCRKHYRCCRPRPCRHRRPRAVVIAVLLPPSLLWAQPLSQPPPNFLASHHRRG